ncbi:MAG: ATP-binding cassette domain-containing protein [Methanosarcinales archaeon]
MGIVGPNAIGKSTFVKILAGIIKETTGNLKNLKNLKVSYKPQYLKGDQYITVKDLLKSITTKFNMSYYKTEILRPLQLESLLDRYIPDLSGGELQRVAIAACLSRNADLYLLDEPSAHLDVEQRTLAIRAIRRFAENNNATVMVVDHDIYLIDLLSDSLLVFEGESAKYGEVFGPYDMRNGMNKFLKGLGITFRRDEETKRPRVNKPDSRLDRMQKESGEYYYKIER